ncbi:MAG: hypothetical protein K0S33_1106 [Bacteroidetes bacterium]|nr:hypothetical protein [Bacteroidota bacterium]
MQKHLGKILEKAVRESGFPISKLAIRINYTRQHMYNLFQQEKVDLMLLVEIGKIIHHDFSEEVKELGKYNKHETGLSVADPGPGYEVLESKYIELLEEYNRLLKEYNDLLKKKKS